MRVRWTAAALLGKDWRSANPKASPPLPDAIRTAP